MSIERTLAKNLDWLMANHPDLNSQLRLSKVSGVGQTTVGRIRRAEGSATIDNVQRLGKAFGVSASQMLDPRLISRLSKGSTTLGTRASALAIAAEIEDADLSDAQLTILANTLAAMRSR
jgi:transcriptional regulator with XRE-family HTH domain